MQLLYLKSKKNLRGLLFEERVVWMGGENTQDNNWEEYDDDEMKEVIKAETNPEPEYPEATYEEINQSETLNALATKEGDITEKYLNNMIKVEQKWISPNILQSEGRTGKINYIRGLHLGGGKNLKIEQQIGEAAELKMAMELEESSKNILKNSRQLTMKSIFTTDKELMFLTKKIEVCEEVTKELDEKIGKEQELENKYREMTESAWSGNKLLKVTRSIHFIKNWKARTPLKSSVYGKLQERVRETWDKANEKRNSLQTRVQERFGDNFKTADSLNDIIDMKLKDKIDSPTEHAIIMDEINDKLKDTVKYRNPKKTMYEIEKILRKYKIKPEEIFGDREKESVKLALDSLCSKRGRAALSFREFGQQKKNVNLKNAKNVLSNLKMNDKIQMRVLEKNYNLCFVKKGRINFKKGQSNENKEFLQFIDATQPEKCFFLDPTNNTIYYKRFSEKFTKSEDIEIDGSKNGDKQETLDKNLNIKYKEKLF